MQSHTNLQVANNLGWAPSHDEPRRLGARILDVLRACGAGYAAAAEYEELSKLSKLSKAELERRGIPGGDLPQPIFQALTLAAG